ncbi:MAG: phosphoenolpyruvate--protein phosphotransferase [Spirochaetales bacterium]|nr:phosphoenolpyruvate--protein phosphotransferase [Spirochaetales bacterium]
MIELRGIPSSPGITIGQVFLFLNEKPSVPEYIVPDNALKKEYDRFIKAAEKAEEEIKSLKVSSKKAQLDVESRFLDAHMLILKDPVFLEEVRKRLKEEKKNIEWILYDESEKYIQQLQSLGDPYLRERSFDIHDVSLRVLDHLLFRERISLADIDEEIVLVSHNLLPSDALAMNKRMIRGIATDVGGKTSHTAILARSFEIPAVLGLKNISRQVLPGMEIIIDGGAGIVILSPDEDTKRRYRQLQKKWEKWEVELLDLNTLRAETRDGKVITMNANIEVPEEVEAVHSHGAEGIGLYRSEFLFLRPEGFSSEEEQFRTYSQVLKEMNGKPVIIRTLDVGGDKIIPNLPDMDERNPILGWRAIRFCLSERGIFETQLRALLRASVHGNLHIMFPMISGVEELNQTLDILKSVKDDLRGKGIPFNEDIPLGSMIEVPSAAMTSDILAKKVDFFSIGTNDLIQYTIAVDRGNEMIAYLYQPFHPGVLRMIKMVIDGAHCNSIPVHMCGEMASDPYAAVILLGLGLDGFSMSSFGIPEIKRIIRSVSLFEAEELVGEAMEMDSYVEIDRFVKGWMNERFDFLTY